jgi:hypothetical protein
MDFLRNLKASNVINNIPSSIVCQPIEHAIDYVDPFGDMVDLEAYITQKDIVDDLVTQILYVLDGTVQLLSHTDINRKAQEFVRSFSEDVSAKRSLKANNIRWFYKRVDSLKHELAHSGFIPANVSNDLLLYLSLFLNKAICIVNRDTNACHHIGWDRFDIGFVFLVSHSRIEIMHNVDPTVRYFNLVDKEAVVRTLDSDLKMNHLKI